MIRVAHVIQTADSHAGGTTTAFFNLLRAADTFPEQLRLSAYFQRPPEGDPAWTKINANPDRFHLAATTGRRLVSGELGHQVAADVRAGKMDLLHIHGLWSPDLVVATRAALEAGVPYVWQSHGMFIRWAWNYKRLKKRLFLLAGLSRCLRGADSFILMTQDELEQSVYPRTITPDRRHLVPLPVELPTEAPDRARLGREGRERFGIPEASPVIAFMGRLHPVKRVELTIEAFAVAAKQRPELRLILLGKGESEEYETSLRTLARDRGVGEQVIFAGWVLGDDKARALCAASALVLNSSLESFGYALFEAIGLGTPALITDNLALSRDFKRAGAAYIAPPTPQGLGAEMVRIVSLDESERAACAERGREWAAREFSYRAVGEAMVRVYQGVVGDREAK